MKKTKNKNAVALGGLSAKARKLKGHDSVYYRQLRNKGIEKAKERKTPDKNKTILTKVVINYE